MSVRDGHRIGQPVQAWRGADDSVCAHPQYEQSALHPEHNGSTVAGPPFPSGPAQNAHLLQSQPAPGLGTSPVTGQGSGTAFTLHPTE